MGRQKSIDREHLLDLAEGIVRAQGASALTIDALAKAAGITKGGVQYTFASKAALIDAICERWIASYDALFERLVVPEATPVDVIRAHVGATFMEEESAQAKAATLMTGMLQSPEFMEATREWYEDRVKDLDLTTEEGRRARLAFLATEGAFTLRYLGLKQIDQREWSDIFEDIETFILPMKRCDRP